MANQGPDDLTFLAVTAFSAPPALAILALYQSGGALLPDQLAIARVMLLPGLGLLYWPIKWQIDYLRRTAPERERAREAAKHQAAERDEQSKVRRAARELARQQRAETEKKRREAAAARAEVEGFYRANAAFLKDILPPALFRAESSSAFPPAIEPEAAWQTARDLIAKMQPHVLREQERRRLEDERRQKHADEVAGIDEQIRAHEARIATLRASGLDPDTIEDESAAEGQIIEQLRARRAALQKKEKP